jgi:hypothetical protein
MQRQPSSLRGKLALAQLSHLQLGRCGQRPLPSPVGKQGVSPFDFEAMTSLCTFHTPRRHER